MALDSTEPRTVLVEGWRFHNYSFAIANQFQLLEMLKRPNLRVYHRDSRLLRNDWHAVRGLFSPEDEQSIENIPAPPGDLACPCYRIVMPADFRPGAGELTAVFGVCDFGNVYPGQISGAASVKNALADPRFVIVTPSQWSRDGFVRAGAETHRVAVISLGVHPGIYHPVSDERRRELRRQQGIDDFTFINIGAMTVNKGIAQLLKAFAVVLETRPSARLVLKGSDRLYASSEQLKLAMMSLSSAEVHRVEQRMRYIGDVLSFSQVAQLLQMSDTYVSPYLAEAFNMPVLEATACGLPSICTRGGPTDDFTPEESSLRINSRLEPTRLPEGVWGHWLMPDVDHLIALMRQAVDDQDLAKRARLAGPMLVQQKFTWTKVVDQLLEVLMAPPSSAQEPPQPASSSAHELISKGLELHRAHQFFQAADYYNRALRIEPNNCDALHFLGLSHHQEKDYHKAVELIARAIAIRGDIPFFHNNLGEAYREMGQPDQAIACYRRAIQLKSDYAAPLNNLGTALQQQGKLLQAMAALRQALAINPNYTLALSNLARVLLDMGQFREAIAAGEKATSLDPRMVEPLLHVGSAYLQFGDVQQTIACSRRAIALRIDSPEAWNNLGSALDRCGEVDEGLVALRRALALKPDYAVAHSNLLLDLHYNEQHDPAMIFREHLDWAHRHADPLEDLVEPHTNTPDPDRRLRIGFVSADFCNHPAAFYAEPIIVGLDRAHFEIYCYSGVARPDDLTEHLRRGSDHWRQINMLSDSEIAEKIREDAIDILIDLSGHTAFHRLGVFSRKPAPVQVTHIGYPSTTGLKTMDYRITDRWADPPGATEQWHVEELIRLPETGLCYHTMGQSPDVSPLPAQRNGHVTFASLNKLSKVREPVLKMWAAILKRVKRSRLMLLEQGSTQVAERIIRFLCDQGVDRARILKIPTQPRHLYLEYCHRADVLLDTFPYNGQTTSTDALWMGVPVVSLVGKTYVARQGLSILTNVGLRQLAVDTPDQYIEAAARLASDLPALAALRANLRQCLLQSPIMDAPRYLKHLEAAYRMMWRQWLENMRSVSP